MLGRGHGRGSNKSKKPGGADGLGHYEKEDWDALGEDKQKDITRRREEKKKRKAGATGQGDKTRKVSKVAFKEDAVPSPGHDKSPTEDIGKDVDMPDDVSTETERDEDDRTPPAIDKGKAVIYTPGYWRGIMGIIKAIPEFVFKKLSF